jgi:amidohydrolase
VIRLILFLVPLVAGAQSKSTLEQQIDRAAAAVEPSVVQWRRQLHERPELSNREFETAKLVERELRRLELEVRTGVAHTGVIGVLRTGKPGPVVALRADMDALPVTERVELPFASKVRSTYAGQEVGVMHACGHDAHTAMLLGAAEVLTGLKSQLTGTVVFLFQPAEEGAPPGEEGGAGMMVREGALDNPRVEKIFGLHIKSDLEVGRISYRPGGTMAASDRFVIEVKGRGAHGSKPWEGVDPVAVTAQIINGLQYIVSRQMDLRQEACVLSVGMIDAGVRFNIIPEAARLEGTIRTLDTAMQADLHRRVQRTATEIAASMGATATVTIEKIVPITYNDPALTERMLPTLRTVAGRENLVHGRADTGAEDFAYYAQKVPGLFLWLGGMPRGQDPKKAPSHHTADFYIDESGMQLGVRTLCYLAVNGGR